MSVVTVTYDGYWMSLVVMTMDENYSVRCHEGKRVRSDCYHLLVISYLLSNYHVWLKYYDDYLVCVVI